MTKEINEIMKKAIDLEEPKEKEFDLKEKFDLKELELKLQNCRILTSKEIDFLWEKKSGWKKDKTQNLKKLKGENLGSIGGKNKKP